MPPPSPERKQSCPVLLCKCSPPEPLAFTSVASKLPVVKVTVVPLVVAPDIPPKEPALLY